MQLFRVEVERTQSTLCFIAAETKAEAEKIACEKAEELTGSEWEMGGIDVYCSRTIDAEAKESLLRGEWGQESGFAVDNDPDYRSVKEWLEAQA
jgi:hypothetical protein